MISIFEGHRTETTTAYPYIYIQTEKLVNRYTSACSIKNTLAVKKLRPRPEKGCDEKDVKSKWGACAEMLLVTLKILIMITQATKHGCNFFTARVFLF